MSQQLGKGLLKGKNEVLGHSQGTGLGAVAKKQLAPLAPGNLFERHSIFCGELIRKWRQCRHGRIERQTADKHRV